MPCGAFAGGDAVFGVVGPKATCLISGAGFFGADVAGVLGASGVVWLASGGIAARGRFA
jgi:hypothetical protein